MMNDEVDTSLIHSFNIFLCEIESVIIKIIVIILKEKALNNFDYSPKAQLHFLPPNNILLLTSKMDSLSLVFRYTISICSTKKFVDPKVQNLLKEYDTHDFCSS